MKSLKFILLIFIFSCSNILYNHNDAMSMLVSKDLVLERFGTPTDIIEGIEYDEYYYDFGVFTERLNYFSKQISTVSKSDSLYSVADNELPTQYRIKTTKKYIKFHIVGEKVIYWESQAVNFPVKKE